MKPTLRFVVIIFIFLYGCSNHDVYEMGYEAGESDMLTLEAESGAEPGHVERAVTGHTAEPTPKPKKKPTASPVPTKKRSPTKTPKQSSPTLYADKNYVCREGPGKGYEHAADILSGTSYRIIGRASNGWYRIAINFANTSHKDCWIGGGVPSGDLSSLPVVEVKSSSGDSSSGGSSGSSTVHIQLYCIRNGSLPRCGMFSGTCAELTYSGPYELDNSKVWLYSTSPEELYFYDFEAQRACPDLFP